MDRAVARHVSQGLVRIMHLVAIQRPLHIDVDFLSADVAETRR